MSIERTELPLQDSPVRQARERLHLTLKEAAKKSGIHKQTWYNIECCCYEEIPPKVIDFLESEGFSYAWLVREYRDYVRRSRAAFFLNYGADYGVIDVAGWIGVNPVVAFREHLGLSRQGLAKELCVQPGVLYKVENGKSTKLPAQFKKALLQVEVPEDLLHQLENEVVKWQGRKESGL